MFRESALLGVTAKLSARKAQAMFCCPPRGAPRKRGYRNLSTPAPNFIQLRALRPGGLMLSSAAVRVTSPSVMRQAASRNRRRSWKKLRSTLQARSARLASPHPGPKDKRRPASMRQSKEKAEPRDGAVNRRSRSISAFWEQPASRHIAVRRMQVAGQSRRDTDPGVRTAAPLNRISHTPSPPR